MKKRYSFLFVAALIVSMAACAKKTTSVTQSTGVTPPTTGNTSSTTAPPISNDIVTPDGKMKFIDPVNFNPDVRPQDDFFEYANGTWLKNTPIPPTEARWGSFNELIEFNQKSTKGAMRRSCSKFRCKRLYQTKNRRPLCTWYGLHGY